jgi:hypothetical protein
MANPDSHKHITGSCHCGNIRFTVDWPGAGPTIPARACGCSMCTKHGGVWTSNPRGRFRLTIADEAKVNRYRFGTRTADFHVCAVCGVVPIVTCEIDGARYGVVNVNAFDNVDRSELAVSRTDFEGEATDDRLARRKRNWTPEAAGAAETA